MVSSLTENDKDGETKMATTIAWTDETWNPVSGCTRVSAGC